MPNSIAINIKKTREIKSISQENMAQALKVTTKDISNWEDGIKQIDIDELVAIAAFLKVDVSELIYGDEHIGENEMPKKQRIKRAVIYLIICAIIIPLTIALNSWFNYYRIETFRLYECLVFWILAFPIMYIVIGATIASAISIWEDLQLKSTKARKYLLEFSCAVICLYILINLVWSLGLVGIGIISVWIINNTALFVLPGFMTFLALNGEKEEIRKSKKIVFAITISMAVIFAAILLIKAASY